MSHVVNEQFGCALQIAPILIQRDGFADARDVLGETVRPPIYAVPHLARR